MKIVIHRNLERALTLLELAVVLAVLAILAAVFIQANEREHNLHMRVMQVQCINNVKETGMAWSSWAGDHNGSFPMDVPEINGGSADFISGLNAYRHFQVMSNELSTPKLVLCPTDWLYGSRATDGARTAAPNFTDFHNSNVSYFVGLDAHQTNGASILSGDRNITNSTSIKNGTLEITANNSVDWSEHMHHHVGNTLFADGSVHRLSRFTLRAAVANTGLTTNHLQMPVLTP